MELLLEAKGAESCDNIRIFGSSLVRGLDCEFWFEITISEGKSGASSLPEGIKTAKNTNQKSF